MNATVVPQVRNENKKNVKRDQKKNRCLFKTSKIVAQRTKKTLKCVFLKDMHRAYGIIQICDTAPYKCLSRDLI